jgi:hypothetical protein
MPADYVGCCYRLRVAAGEATERRTAAVPATFVAGPERLIKEHKNKAFFPDAFLGFLRFLSHTKFTTKRSRLKQNLFHSCYVDQPVKRSREFIFPCTFKRFADYWNQSKEMSSSALC